MTHDAVPRTGTQDAETDGAPSEHRLTTREAAERLGVKPETVYAYVSRGQLASRRTPGGRGSTFDAAEVDALARRTGRREPPRRRRVTWYSAPVSRSSSRIATTSGAWTRPNSPATTATRRSPSGSGRVSSARGPDSRRPRSPWRRRGSPPLHCHGTAARRTGCGPLSPRPRPRILCGSTSRPRGAQQRPEPDSHSGRRAADSRGARQ